MRGFVMGTMAGVMVMAVAASPAAAQQTSPAAFEPGRRAIEVEVPESGGSSVALWWVRSPERQLGLRTSFSVTTRRFEGADRHTGWSFAVGPAIKRHLAIAGPVVPHWRGHAMVGASGASGANAPRSVFITGLGGLGVDWFPADRLAIGAHVGLSAEFDRISQTPPAGERIRQDRFTVGTATSSLSMKLYF